MMARPQIVANAGSPGVKASVSAASPIVLTLDSIVGVRSVQWIVLSTDETSTTGDYSIAQSGSVGQTATTTSLAEGTAVIFKVIVNNGLVKGLPNELETSNTIKCFVPTAEGLEVGAAGETFESDSTFGTTEILNAPIRLLGGFTGSLYETDLKRVLLSSDANIAISGDPSPLDGQTAVTGDVVLLVGQAVGSENGLWVVNTAGAWTRPNNFQTTSAVKGCTITVIDGTARGGYMYQNTNTNDPVVDTDTLSFVRICDRYDRDDLEKSSSIADPTRLVRYGAAGEVVATSFRATSTPLATTGVLRVSDQDSVIVGRDDSDTVDIELFQYGVLSSGQITIGKASTFVSQIVMLTDATAGTVSTNGGFVAPYFATNQTPRAAAGLLRGTASHVLVSARDDGDSIDATALSWGVDGTDVLAVGSNYAEGINLRTKAAGDIRFNDISTVYLSWMYEAGVPRTVLTAPTEDPVVGFTEALTTVLPSVENTQSYADVRASDKRSRCVQTTDATPTNLYTFALPDDCVAQITARVVGTHLVNGDSAAYVLHAGLKRHAGGNAELIGSVANALVAENNAAVDATISVTGADANGYVVVTGEVAQLYHWYGTVDVVLLQP